MVRFVLDGPTLRLDPRGTAAGRGGWLHPDPRCVELARRRGGFARSFRRRVDDTALTQLLD